MSVATPTPVSEPVDTQKSSKDKSSRKRKSEAETEEDATKRKKRKHRDGGEIGSEETSKKKRRKDKHSKRGGEAGTILVESDVAEETLLENGDQIRSKKKNKHGKKARDSVIAEEIKFNDGGGEVPAEEHPAPEADLHERTEHIEDVKGKKRRKKRRKTAEGAETDPGLAKAEPLEEDIELLDALSDCARRSPQPGSTADEETAKNVPDILDLSLSEQSMGVDFLSLPDLSCFYSTRLSLCLPIPAITLPKYAKAALLSTHLAPLLLTYFPPAKGIVIAFQDPVLTATANSAVGLPLLEPDKAETQPEQSESEIREVMGQATDQYGTVWVWLTVTFLIFRPQKGDEIYGWNNVSSEGFVGLVSYNHFQAAVGANRIPENWQYRGPGTEQQRRARKRARKEKMGSDGRRIDSQSSPVLHSAVADGRPREEMDEEAGFYDTQTEGKVAETIKFRVVDTEMVPSGGEYAKWALHIEASLLDEEGEQKLLNVEREKWERARQRSTTPGLEMSGGLAISREGSIVSRIS